MSRARLEARLVRAGAAADVAAAIVARLEREGWLDDRRYAEGVARSGLVGRGWSARRVRTELVRRGVGAAVAAAAIDAVTDGEGDAAEARQRSVARRRWAALARDGRLDERARVRRFLAWLARRGIGGGTARALLEACRTAGDGSG